jgi:hypothetical protein
VPIAPIVGFFPAYYVGITPGEAMYDYAKAYAAWKQTCLDFQWDMIMPPRYANPGPVFELLDYRQLRWPGCGVAPNRSFQFIEDEYMKAEEYDEFLADPSDFMIRTYFPRVIGILEPFKKLPPIHQTFAYCLGLFGALGAAGAPEFAGALEPLLKAAREYSRWAAVMGPFAKEMAGLGFPSMYGAVAQAPFDTVGDYLRGTRGIMTDIFRRPDRLLEAIDKVTPWMVQIAASGAKVSGNPRVFIPLHKGPEGFMSLEQFRTFYWPGLKKVITALIDLELTPYLLLEGKWGPGRLEIIGDIPAGKAIYHFETVDMHQAKQILGRAVCLKGNIPNSLLVTGTPQQIKDYAKKLIDVAGRDGGFIMDAGAIIDDARPENLRALTDFTKEYGVYR